MVDVHTPDGNGSQRWVGEVNASLRQIALDLAAVRAWQIEHDRRDAELFARLNNHLGWADEAKAHVTERLTALQRTDDELWEAINEIRKLVWKGAGVVTVGAALLTWLLERVLP